MERNAVVVDGNVSVELVLENLREGVEIVGLGLQDVLDLFEAADAELDDTVARGGRLALL
jgi:hypothetical protein